MIPLLLAVAARAAPPPEVGDSGADDAVIDVVVPRRPVPPCRVAIDRARAVTFPARDSGELLGGAPGFFVGDHLGRNGTWDWAWRGFDAGHGHDLEVTVDGVPLNLPGHVQQAGYVDLGFLSRFLVQGVDVCSGAVRPDTGAFGVAGSARLRTGFPHEGVVAGITSGTDSSGRLYVGWRPKGWTEGTYVLADLEDGSGVGADRSWRHLRLSGGLSGTLEQVEGRLSVYLHDGAADVPPALRADDLALSEVAFRGSYRTWGGRTVSRNLLVSASLTRPWQRASLDATGWFGLSGYRLDDNRSGFLDAPIDGDATRIGQTSVDAGVRLHGIGRFPLMQDTTRIEGGVELRTTANAQQGATLDLEHTPVTSLFDRRVSSLDLAAWVAVRLGFFDAVELSPALRIQQTEVALDDLASDDATVLRGRAFTWSPRAALVIHPRSTWQAHVTYGRGHRPPDGRRLATPDAVLASVVDDVEAGLDVDPVPQLGLHVAMHGAWSPEEQITDLLTDVVVYQGRTRRFGAESSIDVLPYPGVRITLDGAFHDARETDSGLLLPYVPRAVASVGLFADRVPIRDVRLSGGLRLNYVGPRPLPLRFVADNQLYLDLTARIAWRRVTFDVRFDNLAPWDWHAADFYYPSAWERGARGSPLPVRHVVAGKPFALTLGFALWL
ncbi:MAG: TonB-dependent receptor [Alphaproteobacteria bacterium]|nr:TonB-dependent receptor [Alphaproteobacteria bacterium]